MTPERWQQIRDLLEKALQLAPAQRSAFLQRACASNDSLRQEVETLLAASDDVRSGFLQSAPPRVALASGTRLGEYEVKSLLGAGGMGEVYRARDARLGRDVAIKVLPSLLSADPERLRRFEQEARAAAALNHPNILAVFQMGSYEGAPYLVSELLEGETLREQIKRGRLAVRKAIDYGVQIARGLAAAHEKRIVHRDLKPENLFVTKDGRVKILDFGLAKLTQPQPGSEHSAMTQTEGTEAGVVMGTVGYMAPEQVRGQTADHRADVFAFGAILYEMLSGKRAFQKTTSADTMSAILNEDPPGISQVTTNIAPALQRVVHRCLEKNPEQRFQSASDLAFALDALSESSGYGAAAQSAGPTDPRMRPVWTMAITTALVLAVAFVLWRRSAAPKGSERHGEVVRKQLTANAPGDPVWNAAISRDGKYLAYNSATSKKTYLLEIDSGEIRELPVKDAPSPVDWFRDGSHLLVQRNGYPGLWKVSIWDGTYRKLLDGDTRYAAVSPDGSRIAFFFRKDAREIWSMGPDGENPHRVLTLDVQDSGGSLAWSPTGERLAYSRYRGSFYNKPDVAIETCDPEGRRHTVVLSEPNLWGPEGVSPLSWLPDGRILYSLYRLPSSTSYDIWTVAADPGTGSARGRPIRLTNWDRTQPQLFRASADGRRLIYDSHRSDDVMYLTDLRSANRGIATRRLTLDDWTSEPADWTRDSKSVIFCSLRGGKIVILKQEVGAQAPVVLVSGSDSYVWPVLSPGGDRLLFTAMADNLDPSSSRLMTIPIDGGARSVLLAGVYTYHCGYLPPAGCVLGEVKGQQLVFSLLDPVVGKGLEIQQLDANALTNWSLSPRGTKVAIGDPNGWIRILTIADHKVAPLPHSGTWTAVQYVAWAADGDRVFATAFSDGSLSSQAILSIDSHGNVEVVDEIGSGTAWLNSLTASPDGHYLAYGKRIYDSNVMMLENF